MLKLTNSFYRYLTLTERVDFKVHLREYSYWHSLKGLCYSSCTDVMARCKISDLVKSLEPTTGMVNSFGKHTSCFRCNSPVDARRPQVKRASQLSLKHKETAMAEQPNTNFVSYGGTFTVSDDDDDSDSSQMKRKASETKPTQGSIPPNFRCWEKLPVAATRPFGSFIRLRVLSYNVLAQTLLERHPYLYTNCLPRDIKWRVRSERLLEEITIMNPDILCLQEVEAEQLDTYYKKFEKFGYTGVFKRKTGQKNDGCAIYFKKAMFVLKEKLNVEFYQPGFPLLNRHNIGIMVKLAPVLSPSHPIVIATTHLLYNPRRDDVRLAQMQLFLAEIDRFAFHVDGKVSRHVPIILTGDFNSEHDSAVVRLLQTGHVSKSDHLLDAGLGSLDFERIGITDNCQHLKVYLNRRNGLTTEFKDLNIYNSEYSQSPPQAATEDVKPGPLAQLFNGGDLYQTLDLTSAYDILKLEVDEEATTFQDRWLTVDYMFYSRSNRLTLTARLRLPTATECDAVSLTLPSTMFGSDHLALVADFEYSPYAKLS